MFCRFCGANIPDDSVFCTKCGQKVGTSSVSAGAAQTPSGGGGTAGTICCPKCNGENNAGASFCRHCKSPLNRASAPQAGAVRHCPNCGAEIPGDATMCDMCGSDLNGGLESVESLAKQGNADAQIKLGNHLSCGSKEERAQAAEWFRKAAEQGAPYAQYRLGECYRDGNGVTQDNDKALEWFSKGADQHYQLAHDAYIRLNAQMTTKSGDVLETLTGGDGVVQLAYAEGDDVDDDVSIFVQNGVFHLNSHAGIVHYLVKDGEQVKAGQAVAQILRK